MTSPRDRVDPLGGVPPGFLHVGPPGRRRPDVPAGLGLGEGPAGQLLDLVAAAGAGPGVAGAGGPAFVVGDGVLEVGLAGGAGAGRPGAVVVADLDQAAQPVAGQVGVDAVLVVAAVHGHGVEPGGQL